MDNDLKDRVAIVTGGARGIGRATALLLARRGARVFVGDVRFAQNDAALKAADIGQLPCDVRDDAQVRALVEHAVRQSGGLHIVVSNAGVNQAGQVPDLSEFEWDACLDTNLKGAFLVCKHAVPHLRRAGGGSVIFTSSNAGLLPRAHDPAYGTSKAALIALCRNLALCHAQDRVRFNCVCPGPVSNTGLIDDALAAAPDRQQAERAFVAASPLAKAFNRMITPEEVAEAIGYFASDQAAMVTGTALRIDGGKSLGVPPGA